jgi:Inner membrane component of T3SS, cytoplasmic domain
VPVAVVFLLRAAVLVLLWGFVVATVVAVRHDVFGMRTPKLASKTKPAAPVVAPPTPKPAAAAKPARTRKAVATSVAVIDGPSAGTSVTLSSLPVTIGRAAESTIVLSDDYVSNHHARLIPRGQEWLVEDVGSTNGTQLGEAKVTSPVVVPVGGLIRIGHNVLELR